MAFGGDVFCFAPGEYLVGACVVWFAGLASVVPPVEGQRRKVEEVCVLGFVCGVLSWGFAAVELEDVAAELEFMVGLGDRDGCAIGQGVVIGGEEIQGCGACAVLVDAGVDAVEYLSLGKRFGDGGDR